MSRWIVGIVVGLLSVWTGSGSAAEAEWKVGLARVKITPSQPLFMEGYASRNRPFDQVESDLYAKAMVLEDREGHRAVLVTTDLIGIPAAIAEPICERLRVKISLKREQILLNSAHVHTGPMLSLQPTALRTGMTEGDMQRTIAYTRSLMDQIVEVVEKASQKLEPAELRWGTGVVHFVMNRREWTPTGVKLGANPRGLADRSVPVLRIDGPDGKPRAILFGAAVHNTTLRPQHNNICGDYAGHAQSLVEERYKGAEALFLLGCAGDADPYPHGSYELAREHGASLGKEVCRVLESKLQPVRGPLRVAFAQVDLPLQEFPPREELEKRVAQKKGLDSSIAQRMLEVLQRGDKPPRFYRCPQAVWQFGQDLTLVALSGEVVVDYVALLEKALGPNRLWIAAYSNDLYGYLPSARVLREGGYETRGLYSGGVGLFDPKAQDVLVEAVRKLAREVGRELPKTD
jgi:hypothetical protein